MVVIDALQGPVRPSASGGKAKAAVVMLHGYGADGNDLIGLAPFFAAALPDAVFYSPNAPQPLEGGFGGRQWFGLGGYDPDAIRRDPARRAAIMGSLRPGAEAAAAKINAYLDQIMAHHDLAADHIALLGFSQGTMMSLFVGLRRTAQLGAILGYSGAMIAGDSLAAEIKSKPPVCLIHGDADPVVPFESMADTARALEKNGVPHSTHAIAGLQHGIDQEGIQIGAAFLKKNLG